MLQEAAHYLHGVASVGVDLVPHRDATPTHWLLSAFPPQRLSLSLVELHAYQTTSKKIIYTARSLER